MPGHSWEGAGISGNAPRTAAGLTWTARDPVWTSGRALSWPRERRGPRGGQDLGNRGHEAHPRRTECALRATAAACEWLSTLDRRSVDGGAQRSRALAAAIVPSETRTLDRRSVDGGARRSRALAARRSSLMWPCRAHAVVGSGTGSAGLCDHAPPPAIGRAPTTRLRSSDWLSNRYATGLGLVDTQCRRREDPGRRQDGLANTERRGDRP